MTGTPVEGRDRQVLSARTGEAESSCEIREREGRCSVSYCIDKRMRKILLFFFLENRRETHELGVRGKDLFSHSENTSINSQGKMGRWLSKVALSSGIGDHGWVYSSH